MALIKRKESVIMMDILVRNVSRKTNNQLKKIAKKLRISRTDLINQILDEYASRQTSLPYDEIVLKLKYLEEMSDLFYFFEEWRSITNSVQKSYPKILQEIDLGNVKEK